MMKMTPTKPQLRLLKELSTWGGMGGDTEHITGCKGAAFDAVLIACERRGWIAFTKSGPEITEAGQAILSGSGETTDGES